VAVGDTPTTADGWTTPDTSVARGASVGWYDPHALDGGQLAVDGLRTSVSTTAVVLHVVLALLATTPCGLHGGGVVGEGTRGREPLGVAAAGGVHRRRWGGWALRRRQGTGGRGDAPPF